ncbi:MAG TPA: DUF5667 domain-containing protein, partial [Roseiflexaceae bacterium]|nr:DUF5667 domain-containing protein [Roseiflexaceae bacterium]
MERGMRGDLSEILDKAITKLHAGESPEEYLADYPQFAPELDPLLHAAAALHAEANTSLPVEMEIWVATAGALDFAQIAEQMTSQPEVPPLVTPAPSRPTRRKRQAAATGVSALLDQALGRMAQGASVEGCLEDHPQHAAELEPLLRMGAVLRAEAATPLPAEMAAWLKTGGAHDFAQIAEQMAPRYARRPSALRSQVSWQRAVVGVAVFVAIMGVADTAAAASLPGQPLYLWKRAKEDITISITNDPSELVGLHAEYAKRRISELAMLSVSGTQVDKDAAEEVSESLLEHVDAVADAASQQSDQDVTQIASELAAESKSALERAAENATPDVQAAFNTARQEIEEIALTIPTPAADLPATALPATETSTATGLVPTSTSVPASNGGSAFSSADATATPTPDLPFDSPIPALPTPTNGIVLVPSTATATSGVVLPGEPTVVEGATPIAVPETALPATSQPTAGESGLPPTQAQPLPTGTAQPIGTQEPPT